jgi:hypothetical protein
VSTAAISESDVLALVPPEPAVISERAAKLREKRYLHTLQHYADQLGYDSDKSMKRWKKEGGAKTPPDYPPFDELSQMAAWWRRMKPGRKVPDELLRFEGGTASPLSAVPGQPPDTAPSTTTTGTAMKLVSGVAMPAEMIVQKLREVFAARYDQWSRAVESNAPDADALERKMNEVAGKLRAWEKDLTGIQRDKGEVLDVVRTNVETVKMWSVMAQSFINVLLELAQRLAPAMPPSERRALVIPLKDACFTHLRKTRYAKVYEAFELTLNNADAA